MSVEAKICGLARPEDAIAADEAGAGYLGVILSDGYRRSVSTEDAAAILSGTRAARVAVFVDATPEVIAERAHAIDASVVQLHGGEDERVVEALRRLGDWTIWKSVRARTVDDVRHTVRRFEGLLHGILVEGWKDGAVGGVGARLELTPSGVREAVPTSLSFVLAGGLRPDNVGEAVALFHPDVVDVSSGVEARLRRKDPDLVRRFVRESRGAPAPPPPHTSSLHEGGIT